MANTWININSVIKYKNLTAKQIDWINSLTAAMPDKIKRKPYGKTERILVSSDFAKEFEDRFWGTIEDKSDIVHMKYGIPYEVIDKECLRLYKSHPKIVNYSPVKNFFSIIDPNAFMEAASLTPIKPFKDKNWVTAKQLMVMLFNTTNPDHLLSPYDYFDFRTDLNDVLNMLQSFALMHPDAVYISKSKYGSYVDKFDPTRIRRDYISEFKRHFGLQTVLISKLKVVTKIKDDNKLNDMLSRFRAVVAKSGKSGLYEKYLPDFLSYVKREQEDEQRINTLSPHKISDMIVSKCKHTLSSIEKNMRDFAKQQPDAVLLHSAGYVGLYPKYLEEFLNFAGMKLRQPPKKLPTEQLEIDPDLPGYPSDPDLEPLSDKEMDAIAWRLASKRVKQSSTRANDMIFAEWMKKHRKENS